MPSLLIFCLTYSLSSYASVPTQAQQSTIQKAHCSLSKQEMDLRQQEDLIAIRYQRAYDDAHKKMVNGGRSYIWKCRQARRVWKEYIESVEERRRNVQAITLQSAQILPTTKS